MGAAAISAMQKRVNCFFISDCYDRIAGLRRAICVSSEGLDPAFILLRRDRYGEAAAHGHI
jgi:hypothetical protein